MIQANELRIGNYLKKDGVIVKIDARSIFDIWNESKVYEPIPITEENILRLRRVQSEDFQPLEFSMTPPGKRQTENNFWSNWMNDDYRLHLSPSYDYEKLDGRFIKSKQIKFWFCWYQSNGQWFLPIKNIRGKNQLKYIHQLQNLFFALSGEELKLK